MLCESIMSPIIGQEYSEPLSMQSRRFCVPGFTCKNYFCESSA